MKYYKPNNTTLLYLNSSFNCTKSSSITLTKVLSGTGYTSNPILSNYNASIRGFRNINDSKYR